LRNSHIFSVSMVAIAAMLATPAVAAQAVREFNVPRQPAAAGLMRFAQQANIQIIAPSDATNGQTIAEVKGQFSIEEGLRRLIARSHLRLVSFDGRTAVIAAAGPAAPRAAGYSAPRDIGATGAGVQTNAPATETAQAEDSAQDEIIVTGNTSDKRTLFNSSSNVTLASAADLQRKAPRSTADTLELVPGVFVEGTAGRSPTTIRCAACAVVAKPSSRWKRTECRSSMAAAARTSISRTISPSAVSKPLRAAPPACSRPMAPARRSTSFR